MLISGSDISSGTNFCLVSVFIIIVIKPLMRSVVNEWLFDSRIERDNWAILNHHIGHFPLERKCHIFHCLRIAHEQDKRNAKFLIICGIAATHRSIRT